MEFSSKFIEKIFRHKFEYSILIKNENEITYELLNLNNVSKKKEKLYPINKSGSYSEYLNNHIYKYMEKKDKRLFSRFEYGKLLRLIDPINGYSFDCDFILNKEKLNKKFSFFEDSNNIVMLVEDNTEYKSEQILEVLKSIDNASLLYEIKNDELTYHINYVSNEFASLVESDVDTVYKILEASHPFEFVADKDLNKLSDKLYGNEVNGYHTSLVFDIKVSAKILSIKANISFYLLGKKLYCNIIFEDISDILKLSQVTTELEDTKKANVNLHEQNLTDPLTGLGNDGKYKLVKASINEKIQKGFTEYAVCSCDVNGLKITNDTYGHNFGGNLIQEAGKVFPKYFKHSELFHVGGDEFAVIALGEDFVNFDSILTRLRNVLEYQPYEYEGKPLKLSVAIGSSKYQKGDTKFEDTFQRADDDMYVRKQAIKKKHNIGGR